MNILLNLSTLRIKEFKESIEEIKKGSVSKNEGGEWLSGGFGGSVGGCGGSVEDEVAQGDLVAQWGMWWLSGGFSG
jgi:hypothetical protein